jgi:mannosyltransferase
VNVSRLEEVPVLSARGGLSRSLLASAGRWLPPLLLLIVAFVAYLYALGRPSLWFDEAFSVELARQPLPRLWQAIWGPEPNMELYYLLLHFWLQGAALLGLAPTEVVVRLPSALCAACSVPVLFLLGRRYLGSLAGAIAALLYLFDYSTLIYAQQTRSYAMQLLLLMLSWYALVHLLSSDRRRPGWWCLYVASTVLACYAQLFSLLVFAAQMVAVAGLLLLPGSWQEGVRRCWRSLGGAFLVCLVANVPLLLVGSHGSRTGWLPVPHLRDLLGLIPFMVGSNVWLSSSILVMCGIAVVLILLATLLLFRQPVPPLEQRDSTLDFLVTNRERLPLLWLLLCWFALPILISFVASQGALRLFSARYLVVVIPPLCLLITLGLVSLRLRLLQGLFTAVLLGLTLVTGLNYYPGAQIEDWRTAALWLEHHYQPGDGLICYDTVQGCQTSLEYYFVAYPISGAHFTDDAPGSLLSWETDSGYVAPGRSANAALDVTAIAAYARHHARLFYIVGRVPDQQGVERVQQVEVWLDQHYQLLGQIKAAGDISVRLYAVTPGVAASPPAHPPLATVAGVFRRAGCILPKTRRGACFR